MAKDDPGKPDTRWPGWSLNQNNRCENEEGSQEHKAVVWEPCMGFETLGVVLIIPQGELWELWLKLPAVF